MEWSGDSGVSCKPAMEMDGAIPQTGPIVGAVVSWRNPGSRFEEILNDTRPKSPHFPRISRGKNAKWGLIRIHQWKWQNRLIQDLSHFHMEGGNG